MKNKKTKKSETGFVKKWLINSLLVFLSIIISGLIGSVRFNSLPLSPYEIASEIISNPWGFISIALLFGLLATFIFGRKKEE